MVLRLCAEQNQDLRRYNLPTANNEVGAIIPGDGSEERSNHRDIILRLGGGGLKRISHLHPSYSTLHYVVLFCQNRTEAEISEVRQRCGKVAGRYRKNRDRKSTRLNSSHALTSRMPSSA